MNWAIQECILIVILILTAVQEYDNRIISVIGDTEQSVNGVISIPSETIDFTTNKAILPQTPVNSSNLLRIKRSIDNNVLQIPMKVDWRKNGILTDVKDQKSCGACWAFSVLETIEAMYALKSGKLYDLSVQQLIDCSADGNKCNGGDTCLTATWLVQDKIKVLPEKKYPTTLKDEECETEFPKNGVQVTNFNCIYDYTKDETGILELLANHGPVVAAVNSRAWHDYLGGIIQYHCDGQVDHAVQIVGYDLTGNVPYYIVRNSWGSSFGHDGYLYIKIGKNVCGIAQEIVYLDV